MKLHKEKGLNPKLTFCPRCGGDANEIILIGIHEGKYTCRKCGMISFGSQTHNRCPRCEQDYLMTRTSTIGEYEKLPASEPCDKCKEHSEIVKKGGVYWKCSTCGSEGVLKVSPLSKKVRKLHKIPAPGKCGIDFEGTQLCPVCYPEDAQK